MIPSRELSSGNLTCNPKMDNTGALEDDFLFQRLDYQVPAVGFLVFNGSTVASGWLLVPHDDNYVIPQNASGYI